MGNLAHIYLTAHGEFKSGDPFFGEKAQIGLRVFTELTASAPNKGAVFNPSVGGNIDAAQNTVAGTNGTLAQTWDAIGGNALTGLQWTGARQADLADDMWSFLNAIKAYTSQNFQWTHCKIAPIQPDGKYGQPSGIFTFTTPLSGSGTTTVLPPEVALAVSLRAPILGRRGRGRIYLPALAGALLTSNGTLSSSPNTTIRGAMVTLINNLQNVPSGPYTYMPIVGVTSAGSATAVRPYEVRVGSHFDVQKRRQDQAVESYVSTVL